MSSDEDEEDLPQDNKETTTEEVAASTQENKESPVRGSSGHRRSFRFDGNRNWRRRGYYRDRGGYHDKQKGGYIKMKIDEAISKLLTSKNRFTRED